MGGPSTGSSDGEGSQLPWDWRVYDNESSFFPTLLGNDSFQLSIAFSNYAIRKVMPSHGFNYHLVLGHAFVIHHAVVAAKCDFIFVF
jgi:hypothetical protein